MRVSTLLIVSDRVDVNRTLFMVGTEILEDLSKDLIIEDNAETAARTNRTFENRSFGYS